MYVRTYTIKLVHYQMDWSLWRFPAWSKDLPCKKCRNISTSRAPEGSKAEKPANNYPSGFV